MKTPSLAEWGEDHFHGGEVGSELAGVGPDVGRDLFGGRHDGSFLRASGSHYKTCENHTPCERGMAGSQTPVLTVSIRLATNQVFGYFVSR